MEREATVRSVRRVTYLGMAVNVAIAALKGVGGIWCSSQALVADAVHSLSDLVTDFAVLVGVRYWAAPADEEHPYGHGKIESLVSLFIAVALLAVAYELGAQAVRSWLSDTSPQPPTLLAFFLALVSVVAKEALYWVTRKVARRVGSPALEANAWHHRSDAFSSLPVAVAVVVAACWPQLVWVDAAGALVVSLFILKVAWDIARPAVQELVDANLEGQAAAVKAAALAVPGVIDVHKVRARRYGAAFAADLHIHVDPRLSVAEGHELAHRVEAAIDAARLGVIDAVVHVEPGREPKG